MSVTYQSEEDSQYQAPMPRQPIPMITLVIIASIAVVFAVQMVTGLQTSSDLAGFDKVAFIKNREYWRILTGAALHGGPLHVFMNCYAFYSFGKIFELISYRMHVALVFVLSAVGGGLLSLVFLPNGVSVGASGGICGIVAYLAVYAFRRLQFISAEFRKSLLINIGFILIFGLILYQQIDNFGHIGGFIVGAAYGMIQVPTDEYVDPRYGSSLISGVGLAALGLWIGVCLFSMAIMLGYVAG
jgi:membrane associated rhomboid family serine protease